MRTCLSLLFIDSIVYCCILCCAWYVFLGNTLMVFIRQHMWYFFEIRPKLLPSQRAGDHRLHYSAATLYTGYTVSILDVSGPDTHTIKPLTALPLVLGSCSMCKTGNYCVVQVYDEYIDTLSNRLWMWSDSYQLNCYAETFKHSACGSPICLYTLKQVWICTFFKKINNQ